MVKLAGALLVVLAAAAGSAGASNSAPVLNAAGGEGTACTHMRTHITGHCDGVVVSGGGVCYGGIRSVVVFPVRNLVP